MIAADGSNVRQRHIFATLCLWAFLPFAPPVSALDVPLLTGRIVDNAHLLPAGLAASLSAELAAHEARTSNQVALLTLPSLEGEPLEEFSHRVATTWKLGQKGTDNGVLVLVVPGERKVRIEVGYGLEGTLTDLKSSRIIREEMVPRFRSGDFAGGIFAGVKAVLGTIEGTYKPPGPGQVHARGRSPILDAVFMAVAGIMFGSFFGFMHKGLGAFIGGLVGAMGPVSSNLGLGTAVLTGLAGMIGAVLIASAIRAVLSRSGQALGVASRSMRGIGEFSAYGSGSGSSGGGGSSSDSFSGGGGDFGGGGASGSW